MKYSELQAVTEGQKEALKNYKFPTKPIIKKGQTKNELIKNILNSMGWDTFLDTVAGGKCKIKLSENQTNKLNSIYNLVISDDTEKEGNFYLTIYNKNSSFYQPILVKQAKYMTRKELIYLIQMFN